MSECIVCHKRAYSDYCVAHKPSRPIKVNKRPKQRGKEFYKYESFKHDVAIPYLTKEYGYKCRECGTKENLDVDHINKRSTHPQLKYQLSNLQFLCRYHHSLKD